MIYLLLIICILAFLVGYLSGKNTVTSRKEINIRKANAEILPTQQEYLNFLSYDGSEQT